MARLPSERYLIQQIDNNVVLFEEYTEDEIVNFPIDDIDALCNAQETIVNNDKLTPEDKAFAHLWCGYFYAFSNQGNPASGIQELSTSYMRTRILREIGEMDEEDEEPEYDDNDMENPYPQDREDGEGIDLPGGYGS